MTMRSGNSLKTSYERDGYAFPIRTMDADTANRYRSQLEAAESLAGDDAEKRKACAATVISCCRSLTR